MGRRIRAIRYIRRILINAWLLRTVMAPIFAHVVFQSLVGGAKIETNVLDRRSKFVRS
jgi:hypothetical protein